MAGEHLAAVPIQATADPGGRARVHPGRPARGPGCHRRRGALQRDHDAGQYLRAAMVCRAPSEADLYELVVEDEAPNSDASAGIRAGMTRIDVLLHLRHSDPIPAGGRHGRAAAGGYPGTPTRLAVDAAKTMPVPWTSIVAPVLRAGGIGPLPALPAPWKVADPITFRHPAQPLDPRLPVAVAFDVDGLHRCAGGFRSPPGRGPAQQGRPGRLRRLRTAHPRPAQPSRGAPLKAKSADATSGGTHVLHPPTCHHRVGRCPDWDKHNDDDLPRPQIPGSPRSICPRSHPVAAGNYVLDLPRRDLLGHVGLFGCADRLMLVLPLMDCLDQIVLVGSSDLAGRHAQPSRAANRRRACPLCKAPPRRSHRRTQLPVSR